MAKKYTGYDSKVHRLCTKNTEAQHTMCIRHRLVGSPEGTAQPMIYRT